MVASVLVGESPSLAPTLAPLWDSENSSVQVPFAQPPSEGSSTGAQWGNHAGGVTQAKGKGRRRAGRHRSPKKGKREEQQQRAGKHYRTLGAQPSLQATGCPWVGRATSGWHSCSMGWAWDHGLLVPVHKQPSALSPATLCSG